MTDTAYVVNNPVVAGILNDNLHEGDRAYAIGQMKAGARYDRIVVMTQIDDEGAREWFEMFLCCLGPGGSIVYD